MSAKSADITSGTTSIKMAKIPVFFWLCGSCILTFTLGLEAAGQFATAHELRFSMAAPSIKLVSLDVELSSTGLQTQRILESVLQEIDNACLIGP